MGAIKHNNKVRGLESIYLQRLEPAPKGRNTQLSKRGGVPRGAKTDEKAKFRLMHHRFHDEPEWHIDEHKDADGSMVSNPKKFIEKKFREEFNSGKDSGSGRR